MVLRLAHRNPPALVEHASLDTRGDAVLVQPVNGHRWALQPETTGGVLLGSGVKATSKAVRSLVAGGCPVFWLSKSGLRIAAVTEAPTTSSVTAVHRQLLSLGDPSQRRATARRALLSRFGFEPPTTYNDSQLRGWEGARVRRAYKEEAATLGIKWEVRRNSGQADYLNAVISAHNAVVYTACEAAIRSLLMSPHLGWSHVCPNALVYDTADLFKLEQSVLRTFRWFAARNRDAPMESSFALAKAARGEIIAGVFGEFYARLDAILAPLPRDLVELRPDT